MSIGIGVITGRPDLLLAEKTGSTDGMRRLVSGRDAIRSQVIDALEAQEIKETGNEKG
jgi:hypothetical protein